jgi:diguanylate cyclase (GGDEF)-like protein/PAS domain S-box-containing protein
VALALDGMEVRHAASLAAALTLLHGELPDIVLADLHLPDAEGRRIVADLVAAAGPVPVLALSGSTDPALVAGVVRAGAAGFVPKGGEVDGSLEHVLRATAARHPRPRAVPARSLTGPAAVAGLLAAAVGALLLAGWALGAQLDPGGLGLEPVVPGTSAAMVAAGLAAFGLARGARPALWRGLATGAVALGLAVVAAVVLALEPGADGAPDPWRAAPLGTVALVVAGTGLALTGRWRRAHVLAIPPALIVFAGALSALYGYGSHGDVSESIGTALATGGLSALTFALLLLHPDRGIGSVLASPTDAGHLGRRLVPVALVVPPVFGALRLLAFEAGLLGEEASIALLSASLIVVAVLVIVLATRASIRLELGRASAEEALDHSEGRFRGLAALAPVGILEIEPGAGATFVNSRFCEIAGIAPEQARGSGWHAAVHPEDLGRLDAAWDRLVASGGRAVLELRFLRPDGTATWTQLSAVPLRPAAPGAPAGVLGVVTDIEPFKAAAALAEHERSMLLALLDHAPLAIELRDAEGHVQLVNEHAAAALGRPEAAILGRHPSELLPPERWGPREAREEPVLAEGRAVAYEETVTTPDGTPRHRHVTTYPVRGADGSLLGIGTMALDVTERVEAAAALRAAEERFRGAFAAAPSPVALTDAEGRIEEANAALAALLGRPVGALPGLDLATMLEPVGGVPLPRALAELRHGRTAALVVEAVVQRAGGPRRVTAQAVPLHDDGAPQAGLLWHLRDVTERHVREGDLRHLADHDPLTGLLDSRRFGEALERHASPGRRAGDRGAVVLIGLDELRTAAGQRDPGTADEALKAVAEVLRARLRETDVLARVADDDVAVLLPAASAEEGRRVAEELAAALREELARRRLLPAVSVGMAAMAPGTTAEDVVARAHGEMHAARRRTRVRVA